MLKELPRKNVVFLANHQTYFLEAIAFFDLVYVRHQMPLERPRASRFSAAEETMKQNLLTKLMTLAGGVTFKRNFREAGEDVGAPWTLEGVGARGGGDPRRLAAALPRRHHPEGGAAARRRHAPVARHAGGGGAGCASRASASCCCTSRSRASSSSSARSRSFRRCHFRSSMPGRTRRPPARACCACWSRRSAIRPREDARRRSEAHGRT